jgi:hypothetical protein
LRRPSLKLESLKSRATGAARVAAIAGEEVRGRPERRLVLKAQQRRTAALGG